MGRETVLNLWYFVDENQQFIFKIGGRAYSMEGSDEDKVQTLKRLSTTDHLFGRYCHVPDRYVANYAGKDIPGVAHVTELDNPQTQLFEEVYQALDQELAAIAEAENNSFEDVKIPDTPLFVMTALYLDDHGQVHVLGA
ncbi:hypothetical protein M1B72_08935 [Geomonas paludis]|uniref:Uncharacterized protein n=1 Tax=Geomonas paludis TaxID=2740185 RepID=A0ABY4LIZ9_9BACT|nr:hypothetical protein [Geomonas paludis]UPU37814.1 hypothetical protein M1B72_08935 [Geomonas paludis]